MKKNIILFCFILTAQFGMSCSCWPYEPNFFNNVRKASFNCVAVFNRMDRGYVYNYLSSQTGYFKVIYSFDNDSVGDSIVVTGQDGFNCGEVLYQFVKGDTMLLSLQGGFYEKFQKDTFYLEGACGKYYLPIINGYNDGMSLNEIISKTISIISSVKYPQFINSITITPNPTNGFIKVTSEETINEIRVVDLTGKEIKRITDIDRNDFSFDIGEVEKGFYNLLIFTWKEKYNKKIIIK